MFALAGTFMLTGAAALGFGFYNSVEDNSRIAEERIRIAQDGSISEQEKNEKLSQIPSKNDENQAIGTAGLFSLAVGVAFLGAAAVEASQE